MIEIPVRRRRRKVVNMEKNDMQQIALAIILGVCCATAGCTSRILRPAALSQAVLAGAQPPSRSSFAQAERSLPDHLSAQDDGIVWAADEPASDQAIASDKAYTLPQSQPEISTPKFEDPVGVAPGPTHNRTPLNRPNDAILRPKSDRPAAITPGPSEERSTPDRAKEVIPAPKSDRMADAMPDSCEDRPMPTEAKEEILTPQPDSAAEVVPGAADDDQDRFAREVTDVRLDIRPPQGPLPPDLSADETANDRDEPSNPEGLCDWDMHAPIICTFNPWTICYRPLYFEDIQLERYGRTFGIVQPGVSAAHFFCSVPLMPYKMVVRPPRSCECSNGFSRRGDQPLPGYGARFLRLDAAAVEAAVMAGIFLALP
jgi:hypothetical protein